MKSRKNLNLIVIVVCFILLVAICFLIIHAQNNASVAGSLIGAIALSLFICLVLEFLIFAQRWREDRVVRAGTQNAPGSLFASRALLAAAEKLNIEGMLAVYEDQVVFTPTADASGPIALSKYAIAYCDTKIKKSTFNKPRLVLRFQTKDDSWTIFYLPDVTTRSLAPALKTLLGEESEASQEPKTS